MEDNSSKVQKNDLFLNLLFNPTYNVSDFVQEGFTSDNTTVLDFDKYKENDDVKKMFTDETGKLNEDALKNAYNASVMMYNEMSKSETDDLILKSIEYEPDSFVRPYDAKTKDINEQTKLIEFGKDVSMSNPDRLRMNNVQIGNIYSGMWTAQELAQMHERYNNDTGKFEASPEEWFADGWLGNFFKTTVMATYDKNDPEVISGKKKEGEYKLNSDGSYYTEFLDGRPIYKKEIVSKLDTLTKEKSWINRYDFFDSDGKDKNAMGVIMRNAVSIIPMFVPVVSPYYIGASVSMQFGKVLTTLGRMVDDDNDFFNNAEGFLSSFESGTSEHSKKNTFTFENVVNMFGEVFKQLKEQRFVFEKAPKLFGMKKNPNDKNFIDDMYDEASKKVTGEMKNNPEEMFKMIMNSGLDPDGNARNLIGEAIQSKAKMSIDKYINAYNTLGAEMGRIYMTGITSMDMYNEAKSQGASDLQAIAMTLGYAAGEYAILKTGIGEMVMPELRAEREKIRKSIELLNGIQNEAESSVSGEAKRSFIKKAMKFGKDIFDGAYHNKKTIKAIGANALGEGIEEVTEEGWADIIKQTANLYNYITNDNTRFDAWENIGARYGMSFLGGVAGGGLFSATNTYQQFNDIKSMDSKSAQEHLVYLLKEGRRGEIENVLEKMTLGNKNLSSIKTMGAGKEYGFAPGTKEDNQDLEIKNRFKDVLDFYDTVIHSNGLAVPENKIFDINTLNDIKYRKLAGSLTSIGFLQDANTATVNLINKVKEREAYFNKLQTGDENTKAAKHQERKLNDEEQNTLNELDSQIDNLKLEALSYVNGAKSGEFISKGVFELSDDLFGAFRNSSLTRYVESVYKRNINDLSESELAKATEEYSNFRTSSGREYLDKAFDIFNNMMKKTNPILSKKSIEWTNIQDSLEGVKYMNKKLDMYMNVFNNVESSNNDSLFYELLSSMSNKSSAISEEGTLQLDPELYDVKEKIYSSWVDYIKKIDPNFEPKNDEEIVSYANNLSKSNPEYAADIRSISKNEIEKLMLGEIRNVLNEYRSAKYINPVVKMELMRMAENINSIKKNHFYKEYEGDSIDDIYDNVDFGTLNENDKVSDALYNINNSTYDEKDIEIAKQAYDFLYKKSINENLSKDEKGVIDFLNPILKNDRLDIIRTINETEKLINEISLKDTTPVLEYLDSFGLNATKTIETLNNRFKEFNGNDKEFYVTDEEAKNIEEIKVLSNLAMAVINGSRNDNGSLSNVAGYAVLYNELMKGSKDFKPYEIVDDRFASTTANELARTIGRLDMYLKISDYNSKNAFLRHQKLDDKRVLFYYKGVKQTIIPALKNIGIDVSEIESALNDDSNHYLTTIENEENPVLDISNDVRIEINSGNLKIREALYKVFNAMDDYQINEFAKNINLFTLEANTFGEESEKLNPISMFWLMARESAIDPKTLDNIVLKGYSDGKIAPIPNHVMAVSSSIAYSLNKNMFKKFANAARGAILARMNDMISKIMDIKNENPDAMQRVDLVNDSKFKDLIDYINDFSNLGYNPSQEITDIFSSNKKDDIERKIKIIKYIISNMHNIVKFENVFMVEGVPGAGKSMGVIPVQMKSILSKDDNGNFIIDNVGKMVENVYVVTPEQNKKELGDTVSGIVGKDGKVTTLNHDEFKKNFFIDDSNTNNPAIYINSSDGDMSIKSNVKIKLDDSSNDIPSMIIIDEATLVDYPTLFAISEMSEKYDIPIIMTGDSDQIKNEIDISSIKDVGNTSNTGNFSIRTFGGNGIMASTNMGSFVNSPKMETSMRTDNMIHFMNIKKFRDYNIKSKGNQNVQSPQLVHSIKNNIYYGDSVFTNYNANKEYINKIIDSMFNDSVKNGASIMLIGNPSKKESKDVIEYMKSKGYISVDESTGEIKSDCNLVHFKSAINSQGREADYAICIDNDATLSGTNNYLNDNIYTAMSRSKRGSVMMYSKSSMSNAYVNNPMISTYKENDVKKFAESYIELNKKILDGSEFEKISYNNSSKTKTVKNDDKTAKNNGDIKDGDDIIPSDGGLKSDVDKSSNIGDNGVVTVKGKNGDYQYKADGIDVKIYNEYSKDKKEPESGNVLAHTSTVYEKGSRFYVSKRNDKDNYIYVCDGDNDSMNGIFNFIYMILDKSSRDNIVKIINNESNGKSNIPLPTSGVNKFNSISFSSNNLYNIISDSEKEGFNINSKDDITDFIIKKIGSVLNNIHAYSIGDSTNPDDIIENIKNELRRLVYMFDDKYIDMKLAESIIDSISIKYGFKMLEDYERANINMESHGLSNNSKIAFTSKNNKIEYDTSIENVLNENYNPKVSKKKFVLNIKTNINGNTISFAEVPVAALNNPITMYMNSNNTYSNIKSIESLDSEIRERLFEKDGNGIMPINDMSYSDFKNIMNDIISRYGSSIDVKAKNELDSFMNLIKIYKYQSMYYEEFNESPVIRNTSIEINTKPKGYENYGVDNLTFTPVSRTIDTIDNGKFSMSNILIAGINNLFGLEPGTMFVIVSDVTNLGTNELCKSYMNGKNNATILTVRTPKLKSSDFMKKMFDIITKSNDNGTFNSDYKNSLGNNLTVYSTLKTIFNNWDAIKSKHESDSIFKNIEYSVSLPIFNDDNGNPVSIIEFVKSVIDKYKDNYDLLLNDIKSNKDGIRNKLNYVFVRMFTNDVKLDNTNINSIIDDKVKFIDKILDENGFSGINSYIKTNGRVSDDINGIYKAKTNLTGESDNVLGDIKHFVAIKDSNGNIEYIPFTVYGKVDTPIVEINGKFIESISDKIDKGKMELNSDSQINSISEYDKDHFYIDKFNKYINTEPESNNNSDEDNNNDENHDNESDNKEPINDNRNTVNLFRKKLYNCTDEISKLAIKQIDGRKKMSIDDAVDIMIDYAINKGYLLSLNNNNISSTSIEHDSKEDIISLIKNNISKFSKFVIDDNESVFNINNDDFDITITKTRNGYSIEIVDNREGFNNDNLSEDEFNEYVDNVNKNGAYSNPVFKNIIDSFMDSMGMSDIDDYFKSSEFNNTILGDENGVIDDRNIYNVYRFMVDNYGIVSNFREAINAGLFTGADRKFAEYILSKCDDISKNENNNLSCNMPII